MLELGYLVVHILLTEILESFLKGLKAKMSKKFDVNLNRFKIESV